MREIPAELKARYDKLVQSKKRCEIRLHLPRLLAISQLCDDVVEFGVRNGKSNTALLAGQPERFRCFDIEHCAVTETLAKMAGRTEYSFEVADSRKVELGSCDFLFIDSTHTGEHLTAELDRHAPCVTRYIAMHDTETGKARGWWYRDDNLVQVHGEGVSVGDKGRKVRGAGLWGAVESFLGLNSKDWVLDHHYKDNNGLTIIRRRCAASTV